MFVKKIDPKVLYFAGAGLGAASFLVKWKLRVIFPFFPAKESTI